MGKYEQVLIFDGFGNSMELHAPNGDEIVKITVKQQSASINFFADVNKQSDVIQHIINFSPDAKDLALKRVSYELLTMRAQFDRLIESHKLLKIENQRLQTLIEPK